MIDGHPAEVVDYTYQVRTYEHRQPVHTTVGKRASEAEAKRIILERQLSIKAQAPAANLTVVERPDRKTLSGTAAAYIRLKTETT